MRRIEKQKDANKAIEAVERIDKYIDEHVANAHDMKDSNPDKQYYRGWDEALGEMAGILIDVYSEEKQKENLRDFIDNFPYSDKQKEQKPAEWDEFDKDCLKRAVWYMENPAPSVVKDTNLVLWLKSLPERFNLSPKQEWNEEDENALKYLHKLIEFGYSKNFVGAQTAADMKRWVNKSLRPSWKPSEQEKGALRTAICVLTEERNFPKTAEQLQAILDAFDGEESRKQSCKKWKPSEEQMDALKHLLEYVAPSEKYIVIIKNLYDDLKKLM